MLLLAVGLALASASGCAGPDLTLPTANEVEAAYPYAGILTAEISGNVAVVTIVQPSRHLRRGGALWAKVGPYILIFSKETETLFEAYPGLAAVRAITVSSNGPEIARALLPRNELNGITWRRALNIAGQARVNGTRRPTLLEDLVRWGEEHTEFEYNPQFTRP
jgi:hypothetical protein